MNLSLIDTHAHLDAPDFDKDRAQVIERARNAGVSRIVTVGTNLKSSRKAVQIAKDYPHIKATVGFHPHEARYLKQEDIALMTELAKNPEVVAVGEIGLDFYRNLSPREIQINAFEMQLNMADGLGFPIIIHCRQAERDMLQILHKWTSSHKLVNSQPVGVIHCFSSDKATARQYLDMGFYLAFGGYISYPTSTRLAEIIKSVPRERIVVETDCPWLPPQQYRGQRNEPAYVVHTASFVATVLDLSLEEIGRQTTENALRLFRW